MMEKICNEKILIDDESAVEDEEELEIKQDRKVIILPSKNLKN